MERWCESPGPGRGRRYAGNCELKGLSFYGYGVEYAPRALARNNLKGTPDMVTELVDVRQ